MEIWQTLLLAVVQGIAEFLPISSSGHLLILQELFQQFSPGTKFTSSAALEMNIALHLGTLFSILVVYRSDLPAVAKNVPLLVGIVLATIPVGVIGLAFKDDLEPIFAEPMVAGCALILTAGLLLMSQMTETRRRLNREASADPELDRAAELDSRVVTIPRAIMVGMFQCLGIIPGVSRSGSTIAGGMLSGLHRDEAARFSFLIAIPAIAGVAFIECLKIFKAGETQTPAGHLLLGLGVSFVVGVLTLTWLLRLISRNGLHWFSLYCGIVGVSVITWQLMS